MIAGNHDYRVNENHMYFNNEVGSYAFNHSHRRWAWIGASTAILCNDYIHEDAVVGAMLLVNSFIP